MMSDERLAQLEQAANNAGPLQCVGIPVLLECLTEIRRLRKEKKQ